MGYWGVKSYENDDADDALDAAFEEVHGDLYEELMDDRNPLSFEQVQRRLADGRTLTAAVAILQEMVGATLTSDRAPWDEAARLALAGIIVRHAECGVPIPHDLLKIALEWLEHEDLEWDEETKRRLRREKEIALLRKPKAATVSNDEIR
jgi:hypothetical protein